MDQLADYVLSPGYAVVLRNLAIVAVLVAIIATVVAFANYGRGREGLDPSGAPWALLIGTLRDSFILTLLYAADALVAQSSSIQAFGPESDPFKLFMPIVATLAGPVFQFLIVGVAGMRVLALSRWLKENRK
ncbi:MAG: hypothetical protein JNJ84_18600 [Rhodobacteraceae bacterium]|nr:hypothetical protein [Paracoccaceae bacterium]